MTYSAPPGAAARTCWAWKYDVACASSPATVTRMLPSRCWLASSGSSAARARPTIAQTYRKFVADCGQPPQDGWHSLGAVVFVRGVGFWSQRRGLRGSARNGAELYPVTGLRVVAGC